MTSEHEIQAQLMAWAGLMAGQYPELSLLFAIPNEVRIPGRAGMLTVQRMKAEGMKKGVPDLCLPVARNGYYGLFLENKKPDGAVRAEQAWWLDKLCAQGYLAVAVFSLEEAIEVLTEYLRA